MIIREIVRQEPVQVFGVYWAENERFYWVIPYDGYGGLMSLSEKEVVVVDSFLSSYFMLCRDRDGGDIILHWAVEALIEKLVDRDPLAMVELLEHIS